MRPVAGRPSYDQLMLRRPATGASEAFLPFAGSCRFYHYGESPEGSGHSQSQKMEYCRSLTSYLYYALGVPYSTYRKI